MQRNILGRLCTLRPFRLPVSAIKPLAACSSSQTPGETFQFLRPLSSSTIFLRQFNEELATEKLSVERKQFIIDLKRRASGYLIFKLTEFRGPGRKSFFEIPVPDAQQLSINLQKLVKDKGEITFEGKDPDAGAEFKYELKYEANERGKLVRAIQHETKGEDVRKFVLLLPVDATQDLCDKLDLMVMKAERIKATD